MKNKKFEIGGIVFDTNPKYLSKIKERLKRIQNGTPNLTDYKYK